MLRPDVQWKTPGDVRGRGRHRPDPPVHRRCSCSATRGARPRLCYLLSLDVWLFLTVLFANFASAAGGGARALQGRHPPQDPPGHPRFPPVRGRRRRGNRLEPSGAPATASWSRPGQFIPGDGEIIAGVASYRRVRDHRRCRPWSSARRAATRSGVDEGTRVLGLDRHHLAASPPARGNPFSTA